MEILNTKYHGTVEYKKEDIIYFKKGIPGFKNLKKFIVFPLEENNIFNILHSIEDDSIGIIVISPFNVDEKYEIQLSKEDIENLKMKDANDALILTTVTLDSNIKNITTNLRAPIIINVKEKIGKQIIFKEEKYKIKSPIFKEEK